MCRIKSLFIGILIIGYLGSAFTQDIEISPVLNDSDQTSSESIMHNWEERNFFDVQKEMNDYYAKNPTASGLKQWKRMEHYLEPRLYPSGEMLNIDAKNSYEYLKMKPQQNVSPDANSKVQHGGWLFFGSTNVTNGSTGRVNNIEFHPTNPNILYLASASGGIWKSTNGGSSWSSISTNLPSLAIGDIAIDWTNDVIYVGTGDGHNGARPSIGILKSSDDGDTWQFTDIKYTLTNFVFIDKILIDPTNPLRQFAVTNFGLLRTTNGWTTNNYSTAYYGSQIWDIEFKTNDPTQLILSLKSQSGISPLKISDDSGQTWSDIDDPVVLFTIIGAGKLHLAVTPDNPERVYAFGARGGLNPLLRSPSFGAEDSWEIMSSSVPSIGAQDGYNMGLAVSPTNEDHVIVGKVNTRISYSGGALGSWVAPTIGTHSDVHAIEFKNNKVYHCNDGGLFISSNGGDTFTDHSHGMSPTEIYAIGATPQNLSLIYAGTQDNGTIRKNGSGAIRVTGGDGFSCAVNYHNSSIAYTTSQDGNVYKTTDGINHNGIAVPEGGAGPFFTMLCLDPVDPDIVFLGQDSVHRSDNALIAGSFVNLGKASGADMVTEMVQGTNNRNKFYYSSGVKLYRTSNVLTNTGPASWTQINNELPNNWVGSIEVSSLNANTVYVGLHGYSAGLKVFKSTSSGNADSWENISGSLPNVPINCLKYHNNGNDGLYVGTDIGIFYRDNTLTDWIYFSNHLPVVRVNRLYIYESSNLILAGTFGRGLWISATYTACPSSLTVSTNSGGELYYSASQNIEIESNFPMSVDSEVKLSAGDYIDFNLGFHSGGGGYMNAMIGGCAEVYQLLTVPPNQPPQKGRLTNPGVFLKAFE